MLSVIILTLSLLTILLEYKFRSPFIVFPLGLCLVFSIPFTVDSFVGGVYSNSTYEYVGVWGCLFLFFYLFFRLLFLKIFKRRSSNFFANKIFCDQRHGLELKILVFIALFASLLFFSAYGFSFKEIISTNWADQRSEVGIFFLLGSYLIYMCSGISVYAINYGNLKTIIAIFIFIVLMAMVLKSRSYILAMTMPALVFSLYSGRLSFKNILIGALGLIVLLTIFVATRSLRQLGSLDEITLASLFSTTQDADFGENNLINAFYYYVENNVDKNYMLSDRNTGIIRTILMFIPGVSAPRDIGLIVWDTFTGVRGVNGSFHPTAIGDSYINDHTLGYVIYPFFYALIFTLAEFVLLRNRRFKISLYSVCCLVALYFARGAFSNGYAILVMSFVCFFAFNYLLSVRFRNWIV